MNRQVPEQKGHEPIAVVGNGRVVRHMIRYFELVGQPYTHWFRSPSKSTSQFSKSANSRLARFKHRLKNIFQNSNHESLHDVVASAHVVLLLIPDDQIESFIDANDCLKGKTLVHFSGALHTSKAWGCHPLMTFGHDLYDLQQYQSIPFVVDEDFEFVKIFPLFENSVYAIKAEHKKIYHAMCVMAGNFSQMLWRLTGKELEKMNLPADLMNSYLLQNTQNFINNPEHALTGPFVRGDFKTIEQHQQVLQNHPLATVYQAFYELYVPPNDATQRSQL